MPISRRAFLRHGLVGAGSAVLARALPGLAAPGPAAPRRKNVLFIAVDDLRPELGCYGHPLVRSPNIDTLARRGVLFERNYCQQAVCAPSRASLLTGLRPDTTRVYDLNTPLREMLPDVVTLPQLFKDRGYQTEGMGKVFHNGQEDHASYNRRYRLPRGGIYATESSRGNASESADVPDEAYRDGRLAALAVDALKRLAPEATAAAPAAGRPFFLAVGFSKPHLPFCAPKKYWDLYDRSMIALPTPGRPKNAPDIAFERATELLAYADIPASGDLGEAKTRELIHGYYACVSFMDAQVGKVLAELGRLGLAGDTLVILWGDNGFKLGEYSAWSKLTNFEQDTRVPLIIAGPDIPPGRRTRALTELVDVYPGLAELCGLPVPTGLEGTSFVPLLSDPARPWKKAAFSQYPRSGFMGYSLRTERYRYTEWRKIAAGAVGERELYDLDADPGGRENIAPRPENDKLCARLHDMLQAGWRAARP